MAGNITTRRRRRRARRVSAGDVGVGRVATAVLAAAATLWLGAGPLSPANADERLFVTATGAQVETPPITDLSCGQMRQVLKMIDATGYRTGRARPFDPADEPLLNYEHALSTAHFESCARGNPIRFREGFSFAPMIQ